MKKRIFALLIAVALLVSVIPGTALAFSCEHTNAMELFNNPSTCNFNGSAFYRCNDCGHTWLEQLPTVAHTYVDGTCTVCGWLQIWDEPAVEETTAPAETEHVHAWVEYAAVAPSCETEGNIAYKQCSDCGEAQSLGENPIPLSKYGWILAPIGEHSFETVFEQAATCIEHGYVQQVCTVCGYEHNWSPEPTNMHIVENGKSCTLCGREMASFSCEHANAIIEGQEAATCVMEGWILNKCLDCRATWLEVLPTTAHAYKEGTCTICGDICTEHNFVTVKEVAATCIEYGYVQQACTNCDVELNWCPEPTNIHIVENGKCAECGRVMAEFYCDHTNCTILGQEAASCYMEGWILRKCEDCRQTWNEILPVTEHAYAQGACTICGDTCTEHTFVTVKEIEATCVEHGYVQQECYCGVQKNWCPEPTNIHIVEDGKCVDCGREMASFNCEHTNAIIEGQEAATCTMEGWILNKCLDCRLTWLEVLPALEHTYVESICSACGAEELVWEDASAARQESFQEQTVSRQESTQVQSSSEEVVVLAATNPNTGDNTPVVALVVVAALALVALAVMLLLKKRNAQ